MDLLVKFAEFGLIHCDFNEFNLMINEDYDLFVIDFP
jgi:RIO kinase 2